MVRASQADRRLGVGKAARLRRRLKLVAFFFHTQKTSQSWVPSFPSSIAKGANMETYDGQLPSGVSLNEMGAAVNVKVNSALAAARAELGGGSKSPALETALFKRLGKPSLLSPHLASQGPTRIFIPKPAARPASLPEKSKK
jgi:hypothetical protein